MSFFTGVSFSTFPHALAHSPRSLVMAYLYLSIWVQYICVADCVWSNDVTSVGNRWSGIVPQRSRA